MFTAHLFRIVSTSLETLSRPSSGRPGVCPRHTRGGDGRRLQWSLLTGLDGSPRTSTSWVNFKFRLVPQPSPAHRPGPISSLTSFLSRVTENTLHLWRRRFCFVLSPQGFSFSSVLNLRSSNRYSIGFNDLQSTSLMFPNLSSRRSLVLIFFYSVRLTSVTKSYFFIIVKKDVVLLYFKEWSVPRDTVDFIGSSLLSQQPNPTTFLQGEPLPQIRFTWD